MTTTSEYPPLRGKIFVRISNRRERLLARNQTDDANLQTLTTFFGALCPLAGRGFLPTKRSLLISIAAHCIGWFEDKQAEADAFDRTHEERESQLQKFRSGEFSFCVATPGVSELLKLRVLTEEVGEVANAIDKLVTTSQRQVVTGRREYKVAEQQRINHLSAELVQVAAVCVAWLEALEGEAR